MNTALWILTIVLAVAYLIGGLAQIALPKERFRNISEGQHYADDFDAWFITVIGTIKLVGVAGLVLPGVLGVATGLVPAAAIGFAMLMTGAATTRVVRREWKLMVGDAVFVALFCFLAWGRLDLAPLGS